MQSHIFIWGYDGSNYHRVLVDTSGHLQVDTLSSALPTGAATETTLDLVRAELDGIEGLLAGGLPSDLDTDSLKVREQGTPSVHLYGYDGSAWQTLLVESSALKNLRARLYAGANVIYSQAGGGTFSGTNYGLHTLAGLVAYDGTNWRAVPMKITSYDGILVTDYSPRVQAVIYGFDGTNWDRLREGALSDTYSNPSYALEVGAFVMGYDGTNAHWQRIKASAAGSLMVNQETSNPRSSGPKTTSQLLHNGPCHIYGVTINKDTAASVTVQLIDDLTLSATVVWEARIHGKEVWSKNFWPWLPNHTGLYLNIIGDVYSVIIEFGED